jgi:hypothetical protein
MLACPWDVFHKIATHGPRRNSQQGVYLSLPFLFGLYLTINLVRNAVIETLKG